MGQLVPGQQGVMQQQVVPQQHYADRAGQSPQMMQQMQPQQMQ